MSFDDNFLPRPPSYWHDQSHRAGNDRFTHDRIQEELLAFLRTRPISGLSDHAIVSREVEGEYGFVRKGQIIAYADALDILSIDFRRFVSVFEIKPRIDSIFGVIRQAKSLLQLAKSTIEAEQHYVHLVVPAADPLLRALRAEWPHTWGWGATFDQEADADD